MPVDISQGLQPGSRDPNALIRLNTAQTRDAFLPAGENDWSRFALDTADPTNGLTRPIKVVRGLLNNGSEVWVALDEKGQPIWTTSLGESNSVDPKQQEIWQQTAPKPIPPGGATTQQRKAPDGQLHIYGYNTTTGQYDQDQGIVQSRTPEQTKEDAANAAKAEEGAKNEQALNDERSWNAEHGYGRVTHAERATQVRADEVQARADGNQARLAKAQEDANQLARDRFAAEQATAKQPTVTSVQKEGPDGKLYTVQTSIPKGGGAATITTFGPDGQPVPGGIPGDPNKRQLPPGLPQYTPNWRDPDKGFGSFTYAQQLRAFQAANPGTLTDQQINDLLLQASNQTKIAADNLNTVLGAQERIGTQQSGERNADVYAQTARRQQASTIFGDAMKGADAIRGYVPRGSDAAGKSALAQLVMGTQMADQMGGPAVGRTPLSPMMEQMRNAQMSGPGGMPTAPVMAPTAAQLAPLVNPGQAAAAEAAHQQQQAAAGAATPPAVQGTPSALGDTGAPPVGMMPGQGGMADKLMMPPGYGAGVPQMPITAQQLAPLVGQPGMQQQRPNPFGDITLANILAGMGGTG